MRTTLLLIRHGETPWNALGKVQGCTDIELAEHGIQQAYKLKERLHGCFDTVYSSPLKRAYQTAEILCENLPIEPIPLIGLKEIDFGSWEGMTFPEIEEKYQKAFDLWRTDTLSAPLYDGEGSIKNVSLRAKSCILPIIQRHSGQRVAMVSHGGYIKAALIGLFGWNMHMYHQIALGNTCITTIRFEEDFSPVLLGLNDTSHLVHKVTSV